jgi:hypothetical protein
VTIRGWRGPLLPPARRRSESDRRASVPRIPLENRRPAATDPPELAILDRKAESVRLDRSRLAAHWTGSGEHELLYWIPFLRWLGIEPARLATTTDTGAPSWYAGLASAEKDAACESVLQPLLDELLDRYRSDSGPISPVLDRLVFKPLGHSSDARSILLTAGSSRIFSGPDGQHLLDSIVGGTVRDTRFVWLDPEPIETRIEQPLLGLSGGRLAERRTALVSEATAVAGGFGAATLLGLFFAVPTLVALAPGERAEPDVEIAYRAGRHFDAPFTLVDRSVVPTVARLAG